jgi:hypothetical protein
MTGRAFANSAAKWLVDMSLPMAVLGAVVYAAAQAIGNTFLAGLAVVLMVPGSLVGAVFVLLLVLLVPAQLWDVLSSRLEPRWWGYAAMALLVVFVAWVCALVYVVWWIARAQG